MLRRWDKFFYRSSAIGSYPNSSWRFQNEQMQDNDVYRLVDFSGSGKLIELYDEGGMDESRDAKKERISVFAENEIKPNFFNDVPNVIDESEYKIYLKHQQNHIKRHLQNKEARVDSNADEHAERVSDNASVSSDSVYPTNFEYEKKKCYWQLCGRGAVGETALHMLFIVNTKKSLEIAKMLLELYPRLAADSFMGLEYFGQTCLHFAIINNSMEMMEVLLDIEDCDIHARAKGEFFVPVTVKIGAETLEKKKYEGLAYYGEYPLSFATSFGNYAMYDLLLMQEADPTKTDTLGNTALHMTVVHNQLDMYHHAVTHDTFPADTTVKNKAGLTPLSLAAMLGRSDMFIKMLDISAKNFWCCGPIACNAYPLKDLDTISLTGKTNWNSALMKILEGGDDNHLDMLEAGVVTELLDQKWKTFARAKYIQLFIIYFLHMVCLSCAVYLRPNNLKDLIGGTDVSSIVRYVFEILTCVLSGAALALALREIWRETFVRFIQTITTVPSRFLYQIGCFLLLLCIPFRVVRLVDVEDWLLTFAIPLIWSYFLFFARGLALTGPFITMIYNMVKSDILRFSIIYMIILGTSGIAFFYLYKDQSIFAFLTELGTFMTLHQMSLGEFDYDAVKAGRYRVFTTILFIIFVLMVYVLLLSMVVAMMTRTYEKIESKRKKEWRRQRASIMIVLERSYGSSERLHFQKKYSVELHTRRMTSEGPAIQSLRVDLENEERGILWVHDRGIGRGKRKAVIADRWKKVRKKVNDVKSTSDSDDIIELSDITLTEKDCHSTQRKQWPQKRTHKKSKV